MFKRKNNETKDDVQDFNKNSVPVVTGTIVDDKNYAAFKKTDDLNVKQDTPKPDTPSDDGLSREERIYQKLKRTNYYMEESVSIPIIKRKIGLDPLLGMIPVLGDFASAAVSLSLVATAAPVLNKYTVLRMLVNVYIDALIGAIPYVGSIFDIGWKANKRNIAIYEEHMKSADTRKSTDRNFLVTAIVGFIVIAVFSVFTFLGLVIWVLLWLFGFIKR